MNILDVDGDGAENEQKASVRPVTNAVDKVRDQPGSLLLRQDARGERSSLPKTSTETAIKSRKRLSFVTAPLKRKPFSGDPAASPPPSFHTAYSSPQASRSQTKRETPTPNQDTNETAMDKDQPRTSNGSSSITKRPADTTNSQTALLSQEVPEAANYAEGADQRGDTERPADTAPGLVRFNTENLHDQTEPHTVAKLGKTDRSRSWRRLRKGEHNPGSIVKAEKMLVRVEHTMQDVPPGYDENESIKLETRIVEKWREFVVVCRESTSGEEDFSLQMYKTRVIPAKAETHVQGKATHDIPLSNRATKVRQIKYIGEFQGLVGDQKHC